MPAAGHGRDAQRPLAGGSPQSDCAASCVLDRANAASERSFCCSAARQSSVITDRIAKAAVTAPTCHHRRRRRSAAARDWHASTNRSTSSNATRAADPCIPRRPGRVQSQRPPRARIVERPAHQRVVLRGTLDEQQELVARLRSPPASILCRPAPTCLVPCIRPQLRIRLSWVMSRWPSSLR